MTPHDDDGERVSVPEMSPEERALYDAETERLFEELFGAEDEGPSIVSQREARASLVNLLNTMLMNRIFTRDEAIQFLRAVLLEEEQRQLVDPA
jgi:hypothetical protein